jgi:hypothetical protein
MLASKIELEIRLIAIDYLPRFVVPQTLDTVPAGDDREMRNQFYASKTRLNTVTSCRGRWATRYL